MSTILDSAAPTPITHGRKLRQVHLFGVDIDVARMAEAVAEIRGWLADPPGNCRYVVTPNVDHAVMLEDREDLRVCYRDAALVLADGWPIVAASRLLGKPLPERVAGSDLVPALFDSLQDDDRMTAFLLGAAPGVAARAARRIQDRWPSVQVVGTYSPPLGFENDAAENEKILRMIARTSPEVLIVGLGAPKQELWVHRRCLEIEARAALCVGATIDFLAGHRRRAPAWLQRAGLEWLYRLLGEPGRLAGRYAHDAVVFPRLVVRQWRESCR